MEPQTAHNLLKGDVMKKQNKTQFALIVATAMLGMAQAKADTLTVTSQFTPIEDLSVSERADLCQQAGLVQQGQESNCDKVIIGKNEDGKIEFRDKMTLKLQALMHPTCS
jgi:hypothetical protein